MLYLLLSVKFASICKLSLKRRAGAKIGEKCECLSIVKYFLVLLGHSFNVAVKFISLTLD